MDRKFHIAIFASGAGSTLQTLIDNQMVYGYHVALVVTNRSCMALERAATHGIRALQTKDWEAIDIALETEKIDLIVLAGFLAIVPQWICEKWNHRIINIHPSLLPKHGGKGMYGDNVHKAVVECGDTESGITIHLIDEHCDKGTTCF